VKFELSEDQALLAPHARLRRQRVADGEGAQRARERAGGFRRRLLGRAPSTWAISVSPSRRGGRPGPGAIELASSARRSAAPHARSLLRHRARGGDAGRRRARSAPRRPHRRQEARGAGGARIRLRGEAKERLRLRAPSCAAGSSSFPSRPRRMPAGDRRPTVSTCGEAVPGLPLESFDLLLPFRRVELDHATRAPGRAEVPQRVASLGAVGRQRRSCSGS